MVLLTTALRLIFCSGEQRTWISGFDMLGFEIREHILPCQHVREYFHATASGRDEELQLHIKQYIPRDDQPRDAPRKGLTIIAAHCNGYFKEVYEALWEDLLNKLNELGVAVNSIWMADVAHQGSSGVLNERMLGSEPHWFDHSRDLLHMVNHFRKDITRPIIGIGHSMGSAQIVHLSHMHPRLFHSVIFLDPIMHLHAYMAQPPLATIATFRRDIWPSHSQAVAHVERSRVYSKWDPRAREQYVRYGFRKGPTIAAPDIDDEAVTTTITRHQEAFTLARANYHNVGVIRGTDGPDDKLTHPDVHDADPSKAPFYRPEIRLSYLMLETLRPSCLHVLGAKSPFRKEAGLKAKIEMIGTGVGGSGGVKLGRTATRMVSGGHFFPFECVAETAGVLGEWVRAEVHRSEADEKKMQDMWMGKSERERQLVDQKWMDNMAVWEGKTARVKL